MRKFISFGPALLVLLTTLVVLFAAPAAVRQVGYAGTEAQIREARLNLEQDSILKQIDRAVRAIADSVEPSVVHIGVQQGGAGGGRRGVRSQGSGWVYDANGHIVTNSHVVRGASTIVVQFQDGRSASAEVLGQDPSTDIAVLKVSTTEGLFPISRASGVELHQGERVYAFGSPFGFKFSMSEGIVSGLGRDPREVQGGGLDLFTGGVYTNYIQTDAAVNPGNSGGPLVNVDGKLVGMNVAIATAPNTSSGEGQSSGISFAIPLATIESVAEQIVKGGVISKGYLGISHPNSDDANVAMLERLGYKGRGIAVLAAPRDAPAGKAGLAKDDVITKINGQQATSLPVMRGAISNNTPGDTVSVEVWRKGESQTFQVKLGSLPPTPFELRETQRVLERFGMTDFVEDRGAVYLASMLAPSPAASAGLRPEAKIIAVEGASVDSLRGFVTALAERGLHQGREVTVSVEDGRGRTMDVKISGR